ncbi:MAG: VirB4 family type IV secretion system protein [Breznakia sp.]
MLMNKIKQSRLAPQSIIESADHYHIGENYIRNFLVTELPNEFGLGMLSYYTSNPSIKVYIKTNILKMDISIPLNKEYKEKENEWKKTKDIDLKERLGNQLASMNEYIREVVANNDKTLNITIVFSIKASTKEDLMDLTQELKSTLRLDGFKIENLLMGQLDLFKFTTPIFSSNGFSKTLEANIGVPITTKSFAGMWAYTFETLKDANGFLFAREQNNSGVILWDPFLYLNTPEVARQSNRLSANIVVFGKTGSGKSTSVNLFIRDLIKKRILLIWADPENKNKYLTQKYGGTFIKWGSKGNQINIFDLKPITIDEDEEEVNPYDTELSIYNVIDEFKNVMRLYKPNIQDDTLDVISDIVINMYERHNINFTTDFKPLKYSDYPILSDFDEQCIIEQKKYENDAKAQRKLDALNDLRLKIKPMLTEHKFFFDGYTTIKENYNEYPILAFGSKILGNKSQELRDAMNYIMFSFIKSAALNESFQSATVFGEASSYLLEGRSAEEIATVYRRSRKYKNSAVLDTQEPQDLNNDLIKVHGSSIMNNSTYKLVMQLEKKAIKHLDDLIHLNENELDLIESFTMGEGLFVCGDRHIGISVLATDKELKEMDPVANG